LGLLAIVIVVESVEIRNRLSERVVFVDSIGFLKVRNKTQKEFFDEVDRYENLKVVSVLLPEKQTEHSLADLGLRLDRWEMWFERNSLWSLWREVWPKIRVEKSALLIESDRVGSFSAQFDKSSGLFEISNASKDYQIEMAEIVEEVVNSYGKMEIRVAPRYKLVDDLGDKYSLLNKSLAFVYSQPLVLKVKDGGEFVDYVISKENIINSLDVASLERGDVGSLGEEQLLFGVSGSLTRNQRRYFNKQLAYGNLVAEIKKRFDTGEVSTSVLGIDDGPNTDGGLADRYIEVDISQQKMYLFIDGKLFKSYNVSTGNYYPTPIGEYKILNKAPKAYSDIFGVWMPYWMAFKYADDIGAYLGIHELPYVLGSDGERKYRFGYYIGNKMTGGCVAMEPKDSKEIYGLARVGMIIKIME